MGGLLGFYFDDFFVCPDLVFQLCRVDLGGVVCRWPALFHPGNRRNHTNFSYTTFPCVNPNYHVTLVLVEDFRRPLAKLARLSTYPSGPFIRRANDRSRFFHCLYNHMNTLKLRSFIVVLGF